MARSRVSDADREFGQHLGEYLRDVRTSAKLSAQQVAEASSLSIDTVRSIETGRIKAPSFFTVSHIASALGLGLDQIRDAIEVKQGGDESDHIQDKR